MFIGEAFFLVAVLISGVISAQKPSVQITSTDPPTSTLDTSEVSNVVAQVGENVSFTCVAHNLADDWPYPFEVNWIVTYPNGSIFTITVLTNFTRLFLDGSKYSLDTPVPDAYQLTIHEVQQTDSGVYECSAQLSRYEYTRDRVHLVVGVNLVTTGRHDTDEDSNGSGDYNGD